MSIQKKNGKYVPVVYMGKDPLTGKKINKWGHYWDKKKDAVKEEAEMKLSKEAEMKTYTHKEVTFKELSIQWVELVASQKYSYITRDTQRYLLEKHLLPIFGSVKIRDIEPIHIQKFLHTKKHLASETQRKILYLMKNILGSAIAWNMLLSNPCDNIILPKIIKKEKKTWTPDQVKTFLDWDKLRESKYYGMLLIAFHTGMRPGEIVGLRLDDVENDLIRISHGLDEKKRATGLKTRGSHRIVYINEKITIALRQQRKWQLQNNLIFGNQYENSDYVFTHESGTCITPQQLYVHFKRLVKRCNQDLKINLPLVSLYCATRHSFGTNAIEAGAEVSALSKAMGALYT